VLPLLPVCSMVESGWTASEVTLEHLQNLVSQGYKTTTELATCHVSKDPTSPASIGGGGCHGVCGVLQAKIWCAITPISSPSAAVLWPGATSFDPLEDLAYGGLRDPMRVLYGG
jgi:hypothetical protein